VVDGHDSQLHNLDQQVEDLPWPVGPRFFVAISSLIIRLIVSAVPTLGHLSSMPESVIGRTGTGFPARSI
jgi:hypothetical protein